MFRCFLFIIIPKKNQAIFFSHAASLVIHLIRVTQCTQTVLVVTVLVILYTLGGGVWEEAVLWHMFRG